EDRQRRQRVIGERQEGDRRRDQDQKAPHRRGSLLGDVVAEPLLADVLADLIPPQERDEGRPREDRDDHGDERCNEDPGHGYTKFSATTSSPTASEPFTSTTSPGRIATRSAS